MNWGHGIALTVVGFIVFMTFLVVMCVQQDFYLVTDTYYEEGVAFDERQKQISNYTLLNERLAVQLANGSLSVTVPTAVQSGELVLYRPDDSKEDLKRNMDANQSDYIIDVTTLKKGKWLLQLEWTNEDGKSFYTEESVFIP